MPEILLPTKTQVETLDTKVGTNADAGGTTTLFARLKQMYDNIVTNLGSNADASSATGSVHAKLKDIKENGGVAVDISNCIPFVREQTAKLVVADNTYETLLSITGKGFLSKAILWNETNTSLIRIRITIDGIVVLWVEGGGQWKSIGMCQQTDVYPLSQTNTYANLAFQLPNSAQAGATTSSGPFPSVDYFSGGSAYPNFPSTSLKGGICYIFESLLYFKQSLLIEISTTNHTTNAMGLSIKGGNY